MQKLVCICDEPMFYCKSGEYSYTRIRKTRENNFFPAHVFYPFNAFRGECQRIAINHPKLKEFSSDYHLIIYTLTRFNTPENVSTSNALEFDAIFFSAHFYKLVTQSIVS